MRANSRKTIRRSVTAVAAAGAMAFAGAGGYALAGTGGPGQDARSATVADQGPNGGPQSRGGGHGHQGQGQGQGQTQDQGQQGLGQALAVPAPVGTLSAEEAETLSMMREEERLAHDLYVALGEAWPDRRFDNISAAETKHGDAVATLLANHGLPDPTAGSTPGVYAYPELQELYDGWLERGLTSKSEALAVGAELERLDVDGLEAAMAATDQPDLDAVYDHLRAGSENHLRAFERG